MFVSWFGSLDLMKRVYVIELLWFFLFFHRGTCSSTQMSNCLHSEWVMLFASSDCYGLSNVTEFNN